MDAIYKLLSMDDLKFFFGDDSLRSEEVDSAPSVAGMTSVLVRQILCHLCSNPAPLLGVKGMDFLNLEEVNVIDWAVHDGKEVQLITVIVLVEFVKMRMQMTVVTAEMIVGRRVDLNGCR
jgi:hypothetical protein